MAAANKTVWGIHTMDDPLFLNQNLIAIGWEEMGDLSAISTSRDAYKEKYIAAYPDAKKGSIATSAGMLYRFVHEVQEGDYVVLKPRFSAFFHTELDLILRRLGVRTLYLTGTTTPNCIRTTCYDGLSLDYNVGILTDCCSSNSEEIQQANMVDMANIGATLMTCAEFCDGKQATDWTGRVQAELL